MTMSNDEKAKYAGEEHYRRLPRPDEILFNGNEGVFRRKKNENNEWVEEEIGKDFQGVILRVRRELTWWDKPSKTFYRTTEHNTARDSVYLFGAEEQGIAKDLREKYQSLKTTQVLYVLLVESKEVVRLMVKGASLGSENKPTDSVPFYDYLNSFGKEEHAWQYITKCKPVAEESPLGKYFAISFEKGMEVTESLSDLVGEKMKELHENFESQAQRYSKQAASGAAPVEDDSQSSPEELPTVDAETGDEIKPEDIPF